MGHQDICPCSQFAEAVQYLLKGNTLRHRTGMAYPMDARSILRYHKAFGSDDEIILRKAIALIIIEQACQLNHSRPVVQV